MSRLALAPWYGKRVRVYRNLRAGKANGFKTYSVLGPQGRVVAHVGEILLTDVRFVVREGGQRRVRQQHRKNVHAFIEGTVVRSEMGIDASGRLPVPISYNPYMDDFFATHDWTPSLYVFAAEACVVNQDGVSAAYLGQAERRT